MFRALSLALLLLPVLPALQGCDREDESLATVNGEAITASDLERTLERTLGERAPQATDEARQKALESLVMVRAIAQRQERDMDRETAQSIEGKVRQYREELLVEAYLRANAKPYVPTEAEIADYYSRHPELFGAAPVRSYEILQANSGLNPEQLARLLQSLASARQQRDWRAFAAQLKKQGYPVVYLQGRTDGPSAPAGLSRVIESLSANGVSDVFYLDKKPHLLRVRSVETTPARSLDEVRAGIRKTLAVNRMKESIREIGQEVLKTSDVKYRNAE